MSASSGSSSGQVITTPGTDWFCDLVWAAGEVTRAADATLSPLDHGLLVGDGVFETAKIIDNTPFALTRHLARLRYSATQLGLEPPSDDAVRNATHEVIAANSSANRAAKSATNSADSPLTRVRITLSGGPGPLGSGRGSREAKLFVAVATTPHPTGFADVITVPWARNDKGALVGLKTTSYAENVRAIERARDHQASEAIFGNTQGELCEGTGTNVFVVTGGRVVTPPLSSGCLAGITRELVLESTDAVEKALPMGEFVDCEEAFLTSSTRDVMPISSVDGRPLAVIDGPSTQNARAAFASLVAKTLDP